MAFLVVPNKHKTPREAILLGKQTVEITDCNGNKVTVHGLTANDLQVVNPDGSVVNFVDYVDQKSGLSAGEGVNMSLSIVTSTAGNNYELQDIVDGYENISYQLNDMQTKYNEL